MGDAAFGSFAVILIGRVGGWRASVGVHLGGVHRFRLRARVGRAGTGRPPRSRAPQRPGPSAHPAAAPSATTATGARRHDVRSTKQPSATAKSAGRRTLVVKTGS